MLIGIVDFGRTDPSDRAKSRSISKNPAHAFYWALSIPNRPIQ